MEQYIIQITNTGLDALNQLNQLASSESMTLFVKEGEKLKGTITDGDIRRGLLKGHQIDSSLEEFVNRNFHYLVSGEENIQSISAFRKQGIKLIPILDKEGTLIEIFDLAKYHSKLSMSALLMAGGLGTRLKPLTDKIPKPMLVVGDKPIIEHNIDYLIKYGVKDFYISVKYLKEQIISYFGDGSKKGISITYIEEEKPLGTLGALSEINEIEHENLLVMNSDLLTDLNFESFYKEFIKSKSKMTVLSIPYDVSVPYAVLETKDKTVTSFIEKPTYTYYSNGGIYLIKFSEKSRIPKNTFYNATDMMEELIKEQTLSHYIHRGFWLDIGKPKDFEKSQNDIKHLKL